MIHIDRSQVPIPPVLLDEKRGGIRERNKAIEHYHNQLAKSRFGKSFDQLEEAEKMMLIRFAASQDPDAPLFRPAFGENFTFKTYSVEEVKRTLHQLFHGKCAYCESRIASTQPMDVEHWRPKGGYVDESEQVKETLAWPGYYWLAASWNNLLPSCIDCNRRRNQFVWSQTTPLRLGKENQFPVADELRRWRDPDQLNENDEEPLLLDPCAEKPEDYPEQHLYFKFDQESEQGVLLPRPDPNDNGRPSPKAVASIRVYALNRTELVLARQERLRLLEFHKQTILRLAIALQRVQSQSVLDEELVGILKDLLSYEFAALERFTEPDQPYALLARQFVQEFNNELLNTV